MRGDRRRLLYKGRRRSHRFTILDDGAFEYDCIFEREPDSNVISLVMEGAEKFDFYRQPDFVHDPFLKGSYAVYKKETFIGEGTGKLCHIHRPQIIDARGRRCWGDLSIEGNKLLITIPERWLSEASYPVIIDPTIGTNTIGSQTTGKDPNNNYNDRPWLDSEYSINKYLVPQNCGGLCTAYIYTYNTGVDDYVTPFLYLHNNTTNKPYQLKSKNEKDVKVLVQASSGNTAGWRNNTFEIDGVIPEGDYVWFGVYNGYFTTRFDYGGICYKGWFSYDLCPEYEEIGGPPPYMNIGPDDTYCTIKWSWYFSYTAVLSQNFKRTITQGVTLSDSKRLSADFKRSLTQLVQANSSITKLQTFKRKLQDFSGVLDTKFSGMKFLRLLRENSTIADFIGQSRTFFRVLLENAGIDGEIKTGKIIHRILSDTVKASGYLSRGLQLIVRIVTGVFIRDYLLSRFLVAQSELVLKSCVTREIILESKIC